jgi:hypothetical protein
MMTGKRATLFTTNPTRTGLRMRPYLHGDRPAADSLISYQNLFNVLADFGLILISL